MFIGICVPTILGARYGGAHQWDTRVGDVFKLLYYSYIVQTMYGPVIFTVKLSILLQYLHVFVPSRVGSLPMYWGIHIVLGANFLLYFIDTWIQIFSCSPIAFSWNKLLKGHCVNVDAGQIATGTFNVISDFAILLLPMYSISRLQLPRKRKLGICALFGTGFLACISSTARLIYSIRIVTTKDVTFNIVAVAAWAMAEIAIGILCSCLPVTPKFVRTVGPRIYSLPSNLGAYLSGRSRTTATATATTPNTSRKGGAEKILKGVDPYDPENKLNNSVGEYRLETWEMTPGGGEEHTVEITSPSITTSDAELVRDGQIVQTVNFEVESFEQKDGNAGMTSWRQV